MKFLLNFFIAFFICFVLWIALVFGQVGGKTKISQWVYDAYAKKIKIANKIKDNKIIIVSGSNSLFGINSKMLEQYFGQKVVNFGVNAGVLLPYTLYKAKKVIEPNDTVILPLEYPMYNYNGVPNFQMIDYIFSRDFDVFYSLSLKEQFLMVWNITFDRVQKGYASEGGKKIKYGLYGAHRINSRGDQKKTSNKYKTKQMYKELENYKANKYGEEFDKDSISWDYLNSFVSWCKQRNVKVIFTPSTLMYFDTYKSDAKEKWFYENLPNEVRKMGWVYIGNPYDYMYDKSLYFNTDFHLTNEGRDIRTKQMIKDLSYIIGKK